MSIKKLIARTLPAVALAAAALGVTSPASASNGVTQVDGLLVYEPAPGPGTVCDLDIAFDAAYTVTGSIEGCWYITSTSYDHSNSAGGFVASGDELFDGCWAGTQDCGTFTTVYKFTAKYDGATELHGRCHHPITGGDGTFADAGGVINMHDNPDGSANFTGHLDLSGSSPKAASSTRTASSTTTSTATQC